jgi:D-threo-aldose 1-dehydrogenase
MCRITLHGGDQVVSRLIFGTAKLFTVGVQGQRVRLLEAAVDSGFTHFDTAPLYGFGTGEVDLGVVLARHPDLTVTTKVGLYPPGGASQPEAAILLRKAAGRLVPATSRPVVNWTIDRARRSLADSLKRLRRERIDLYLLHEPDAATLNTDEWLRWLEMEKAAGKVGRFGLAGDGEQLKPLLAMQPSLADIVQTNDSLTGREADALVQQGRFPHITFGYLSAALGSGHVDVQSVMAQAFARNRDGAIIVSTGKVERMKQWESLLASQVQPEHPRLELACAG